MNDFDWLRWCLKHQAWLRRFRYRRATWRALALKTH